MEVATLTLNNTYQAHQWLVSDTVGILVHTTSPQSNGEFLTFFKAEDRFKPCVLIFYKITEDDVLCTDRLPSTQRIREFLLSGVQIYAAANSHLCQMNSAHKRIYLLRSITPDFSDIEIELHVPPGSNVYTALCTLDQFAAGNRRTLEFWIPLITAYLTWYSYKSGDVLAANWFIQHMVDTLEQPILGELASNRSQNNQQLWASRNLKFDDFCQEIERDLTNYLKGSTADIRNPAACPTESIFGIVLSGFLVNRSPTRKFANLIPVAALTPEEINSRKLELAYLYALRNSSEHYKKLVQQQTYSDWSIAIVALEADYLQGAEIDLRLGQLKDQTPEILTTAVGRLGEPDVDEVDEEYARGLGKELLNDANTNRRYTPSGLYHLQFPPGLPVHEVESLYLWVAKDCVVVRPEPFGSMFVWFPGENGLSNSWSPLVITCPQNMLVWELIMTALWRDMVVGIVLVDVPILEGEHPKSRDGIVPAAPRQEPKSTSRRGLRLPTRVSNAPRQRSSSEQARRCIWAAEEEIERIRRLHKVRGHPRRLRPGQKCSQAALQRAQEYHFLVPDGYTFVRPYVAGGRSQQDGEIETPIQALGLASLMMMERKERSE